MINRGLFGWFRFTGKIGEQIARWSVDPSDPSFELMKQWAAGLVDGIVLVVLAQVIVVTIVLAATGG